MARREAQRPQWLSSPSLTVSSVSQPLRSLGLDWRFVVADRILIEDATKPAPQMAELLRRLAGDPEAILEHHRQRCIRAIRRGDTYGFPPAMVEDCRKIIAEEIALRAKVADEINFTIEHQRDAA